MPHYFEYLLSQYPFTVVAMWMSEQRLRVGHSDCLVMVKIIRAQDPGFSLSLGVCLPTT